MGNFCKNNYANPPELEIDRRQWEENNKSLTSPQINQILKELYVDIKQIHYF